MLSQQYFIYILTSKPDGVLYIGLTRDLFKRVYQHKNDMANGFTRKYHIKRLVYFEACDDIQSAIVREKQLKAWKRQWKINLIEKNNPEWKDLYPILLRS